MPVCRFRFRVIALMFLSVPAANGAVLPEDRSDLMYHHYDGGGITVSGPALLVRKGVTDNSSLSVTSYVDNITSASIDVITKASEYTENRDEFTAALDYLYNSTTMNLSYTVSDENDYNARTMNMGLSQEVFGGMTTVSMGYSNGSDTITRTNDQAFQQTADRNQYSFGLTQIITSSMLMSVGYELIADSGYLQNPYRGIRLGGPTTPFVNADEVYPRTRKSHAASLAALKYLPSRSSIRATYRYFWDTWDIRADTFEVGYSKYLFGDKLTLDGHLRYYQQDQASFYADYFLVEQEYMARDKELSSFSSNSIGVRGSYRFYESITSSLSASLSFEYIQFEYENFSDLRPGKNFQPYEFDAKVMEIFFTYKY